jgi:hypothetical protein
MILVSYETSLQFRASCPEQGNMFPGKDFFYLLLKFHLFRRIGGWVGSNDPESILNLTEYIDFNIIDLPKLLQIR